MSADLLIIYQIKMNSGLQAYSKQTTTIIVHVLHCFWSKWCKKHAEDKK